MRVTEDLLDWLHAEWRRRYKSYSDLARAAGGKPRYQSWSDLLQGKTDSMGPGMEDAVCRVFNVSHVELLAIAEGDRDRRYPDYGATEEMALALWRWISYDAQRRRVIEAMGYSGTLPDDVHESRPSSGKKS